MLNKFWDLATRIPLQRRLYQVVNAAVATVWGRHLELVHVVEYPRCGGTWVRHMLQSALDVPQYAINRFLTRGTIIQTHSLPQPAIRKPIVVLRDPRDAMVSFYFKKIAFDQRLRRGERLTLPGYIHDPNRDVKKDFCVFLASHLRKPVHPRFTFSQFVKRWILERSTFSVRYEDCKADAATQLSRMIAYVGREVSGERVQQAVAENSFEMRTAKRTGQARAPGNEAAGQFERKGIVGDWKNLFTAESVELFERFEGDTLMALGYESDGDWARRFLAGDS